MHRHGVSIRAAASLLLLGAGALGLAACSNKLDGQFDIDGSPFVATSCRSGKVYGFAGVELTASDGRRVRAVATPDGGMNAIYFAAGQDKATEVPSCGTLKVSDQSSVINDIRNVEGTVKLDCSADHKMSGTINFSNCH